MTGEEEVVDNYLVWELCKQQGITEAILADSPNGQRLKQEIVDKVRKEYHGKGYSLDQKINRVKEISSNPAHMVEKFEGLSWRKETAKVEDLGTTLPRAGDLPPEAISGSLPELLEFVRNADPEEYRSVEYINGLKQVPEVLEEFETTVISPGEIIRQRQRMNKVHGKKAWNIEKTWGAVHDGNHRTLAKILENDLEEIECYVGRPENEE